MGRCQGISACLYLQQHLVTKPLSRLSFKAKTS